MIQITTNLASSWAAARSKQRAQQAKYTSLIQETQEEEKKLRAAYEQNTAYLFRSAAERTRQAYENARAQLAAQQAQWASHGLTGQSAAVADETAQTRLRVAQQEKQTQRTLQESAAQEEQNYKTAWQKLREALTLYRRAARKKSRWGSFGQAVASLFK